MSNLSHLLEPLTLLWLALLGLSLWLWRRGVKREARVVLGFFAVYTVLTCTPSGHWLVYAMERPWVRWEWDSLSQADVVLCLGGGISPAEGEISGVDVHDASDRVTTAIELMRRGKAKVLVISGGMKKPQVRDSESQSTFEWIQRWGLVQGQMLALGESTNTHDEAVKMRQLCEEKGWSRVLLVTSATHMRRASATFHKAGVNVVPVACAYVTDADERLPIPRYFHLPDHHELERYSQWIHEQLGYVVYRLRGWI